MSHDLRLKLIAVTDSTKLKLYEAKGLKILNLVEEYDVENDKHHRGEKHESSYHKGPNPGSAFEPHTSAKEIEHTEAARVITHYIEKIMHENSDYKELIVTAEPKMLGFLRHHYSKFLKDSIVKEIAKGLTHHDMQAIEHAIFSE